MEEGGVGGDRVDQDAGGDELVDREAGQQQRAMAERRVRGQVRRHLTDHIVSHNHVSHNSERWLNGEFVARSIVT